MNNAAKNISAGETYPMRPAALVMDISRLGSLHQSRLSFMRQLMRKMMRERWQIQPALVDLDEHGYGTQVYAVAANGNSYSFVLFSDYLPDEERNDRVIAEKWDVTMAFCIGDVNQQELEVLRGNVPKQEAGRVNSKVMVLSRGNKSSRNFNYVVEQLAAGQQPDMQYLAKVGYLYRTTAVYGSGKFGSADWQKVTRQCPEFASPFAAEMFTCFLLRQFSLDQAEHLARIKSPHTAVALDPQVKRYFGIGNSTGLGMAPYLIRHPLLISRWVLTREKTLARIVHAGKVDAQRQALLGRVLARIVQHFSETFVPDDVQTERNRVLLEEVSGLQQWLVDSDYAATQADWLALQKHAAGLSLETQEVLNSALMEVHPELVDNFESYPCVDEHYRMSPAMRLAELKELMEQHYDWALAIDFSSRDANHYFWYRSEEKMEPRIGERFNEPGQEKEMPLTIARMARNCYDRLCAHLEQSPADQTVAEFLLQQPDLSGIVARIQTMSQEPYGEIRGNLAGREMLPMDLLRCKLSFFGVSKFDPKSRLWVRNTMFQGAPLVEDVNAAKSDREFVDDWYFPVAAADAH